ncbi:hypothetical protein V6R85_01305 [Agrobacterium sp. CCNWLW32]|uniref:hypothetical protein n=1 Tax=Agrobacterium sp. CCNWLW32 TaxID=3122072 RepID=UPI00300FC0A2
MAYTFEMNGKSYQTDKDTLEVIRSVMAPAKASNDFSAVIAVMTIGEKYGRIRELA